jgi:hypothetical protein
VADRSYIALDRLLLNGVHIRRLGMSIYLLAFFVDKQTDPDGDVFYGKPITYRWIREELPNSPPERTLRMWLTILRSQGYIEVSTKLGGGMRVRVVASKKWPTSQLGLFDRSLSKTCDIAEDNLSICGNVPRQDVAGESGKILPSILYLEKDRNSETNKSNAAISLSDSELSKTPKHKPLIPTFRVLFGNLVEKLEEKKKIS